MTTGAQVETPAPTITRPRSRPRSTRPARSSGELTCWGKLEVPNSAKPAAAPHSIPIGDDVAIAMADWTTCLISRDRLASCFGYNSAGQLGDGSVLYSDAPVGIPLD